MLQTKADEEGHFRTNEKVDMKNSKRLAGLIGPTLVALAITEIINLDIWAINIPPVIYLNGTLLFIAGLSIIRSHNYWIKSWCALVTFLGWMALLFGLYRMFLPGANQGGKNPATYAVLVVLLLVGIFLTFKAYSRNDRKFFGHK